MKNRKNPKTKALDFKKSGIFLFLLMGKYSLSNRLPWGQKLPHQYLPVKKAVVVKPAIINRTKRPNLGSHKPPIATNKVINHAYLLMKVKVRLVLM